MFPCLLNLRDLGGYPTADGAITRRRSLLRADDLAQLSPQGLAALADFGLETVLDLRWPEEAVYSMLDYLDGAGGTRAYLGGIGLAEVEIDRLRARLR